MGLTERLPDDGRPVPRVEPGPEAPVAADAPATPVPAAAPRTGLRGLFSAIVGLLLVIWFFIAWLGLDRPAADAAGESVGSAFALLLVVSAIGAFRDRER